MRFEMNRDYLTGEYMESLIEKGRCKINYMYGYDIY